MNMILLFSLSILFLFEVSKVSGQYDYDPTWDSLESRPLPDWFDKAKIGIFIHWGVYAVPCFWNEWFWHLWKIDKTPEVVQFMEENYPPDYTYQDFAKDFRAEFYQPSDWADLFYRSGAKYVVLTSKHHEGYTLWPSPYSYSWNSMDVGAQRDLLGELASAVKERGLHFGTYYSLLEWFHPLYQEDQANNWQTTTFADTKAMPELRDLVTRYEPDIIWTDGSWEAPSDYWKAREFLAWLYNESPVRDVVVANDRWGSETSCIHGGYITCTDRYNPGMIIDRKWENAMTIDYGSWGCRRNLPLNNILSPLELITNIANTVAFGGNILLDIGPTSDGRIKLILQERLEQLGQWLSINGDAIYESNPWSVQNDTTSGVWYTSKGSTVYAIVLFWPDSNILVLNDADSIFQNSNTQVTLLGNENTALQWEFNGGNAFITFPDKAVVKSEWSYVLKIVPA